MPNQSPYTFRFMALSVQGKIEGVEPLLERAVGILEKVHGIDHPELASILCHRAAVLLLQVIPRCSCPRSSPYSCKNHGVLQNLYVCVTPHMLGFGVE